MCNNRLFQSLFGMTETSPSTFQNFYNDTDERMLSTVGYIHDHVEVSWTTCSKIQLVKNSLLGSHNNWTRYTSEERNKYLVKWPSLYPKLNHISSHFSPLMAVLFSSSLFAFYSSQNNFNKCHPTCWFFNLTLFLFIYLLFFQ